MAKTCNFCGKRSYGEYCMQHKPRKRIPKEGKKAKSWRVIRKEWFDRNPATIYRCYIGGGAMDRKRTTLDHVKPRGSHPELFDDLDNLKPCCSFHNDDKGSMSLEKYLASDPDMKCRDIYLT